ncbi:D-alanyl-D-alanine carboxypeptidase family protein [Bacillus sp. Brlt_9]|uniref:D-alanyl-D-alanine carboxypeptidase family protein n=1 Tax=Bacillus sp. Brlt_9 TaxID=3110916 RepID=UPI003F7C029F
MKPGYYVKKISKWIIISFCLFLVISALLSALLPALASAEKIDGPKLYSESAFLYNLGTDEVLYQKADDKQMPIHSLASLMTTYILIEDLESGKVSPKDKADISEKAWRAPEPRMFLEVGRTVTAQKLLEGLIIASGNDAAITTAEFLSGSTDKFVKRMNSTAKELGMKNTKFSTPNGSSSDLSSAKDLFILTKALIDKYPKYLKYFTKSETKYDTRPGKPVLLRNQNSFISENPNANGLKNGWGKGSYHLIGTVNKNGMKLLAVTLDTSSPSKRSQDVSRLLNYGYDQYQVLTIARAGQNYSEFGVYKSDTPGPSNVIYKEDTKVVTRKGVSIDDLKKEYEGQNYVAGGNKKGDVLGTVNIYHEDKLLTKAPIAATETFKETTGFKSAIDSIALMFKNLFDWITNSKG